MQRNQTDYWMRRALHLARPHVVAAWPNPSVGACLVKDGRLIGEGYHRGAGQPHAEAEALSDCSRRGHQASGATLYVTLEPCNHQGRTPPCSEAVLRAGIARVVYAVRDSNPGVSGGGAAWLSTRGVEVVGNVMESAAWELNHRFFETDGGKQPHVTLKLGVSVDGRLARRPGRVTSAEERRITGWAAQRRVQRLRASSSAIIVGNSTVQSDHPRLTVRGVHTSKMPRPVILDSDLRLPSELLPEGSLVIAAADAPSTQMEALEKSGFEVALCGRTQQGLDWPGILRILEQRGLGCVLVEGGAKVAQSLLSQGHAHRILLFQAPLLLGGQGASLSQYQGLEKAFSTQRVRRVGADVEWLLTPTVAPAAKGPN